MTSEAWIALAALGVSIFAGLWKWSSSFEKKIVELFSKQGELAKDVKENKSAIDSQGKDVEATDKKLGALTQKHDEIAKDVKENKSAIDAQSKEVDAANNKINQVEINNVKMQKDIDTLFYQFKEQKFLLQNISKDIGKLITDVGIIKSKMNIPE